MGATGNATGVHTHIECRIDNTAVDPTPYLKIKNEKATGLVDKNYTTTVEESNEIMQKMLDKFDGKSDDANYKKLYEEEKAKFANLANQVKTLDAEVATLKKKIANAKSALE
jgi:hypothetical protein